MQNCNDWHATKCANAEFFPEEMRLEKSEFQFKGCKWYSLLILWGYLVDKHVHVHFLHLTFLSYLKEI